MPIDLLLNAPVEFDAEQVVGSGDFPGVAILKPGVGNLDLGAVDNTLVKDAVLVADAVTVGGQLQGGQGVKETRSQSAQTAVAQASVPLGIAEVFEGVAKLAQGLATSIGHANVQHGVAKGAPHQEFQGEVVYPLGVVAVVGILSLYPVLNHAIAHRQGHADVGLPCAVNVPG